MLQKFCKLILWLLPPLMIYGHLRAIGATWNYAERTTFSPVTNYVSDYAYRSPAWWAIVACIYGFAFVLGFISWHAASRPRTLVSWVVAAAAAIAMFKMTEVAQGYRGTQHVDKTCTTRHASARGIHPVGHQQSAGNTGQRTGFAHVFGVRRSSQTGLTIVLKRRNSLMVRTMELIVKL